MRTPDVHREIERKLEVPDGFRVPRPTALAGMAGAARAEVRPTLQLEATYFDTADLRLARQRVTLRRRTGGDDDGWHLKLPPDDVEPQDGAGAAADGTDDPVSDHARDELHLPLATPGATPQSPPDALATIVLGITRGAPLAPVATLHTTRRRVALTGADGQPLAELTDDRVRVVARGRTTSRFRELEVEAAGGRTADDLDAVVAGLIAAGATESNFMSKAVRALGPAAQGPPDIVAADEVTPQQPAGAAVRAHLARHAAAFQAEDLRLRRDLPDAVHQMRVAARRLRSGLQVFGPLVDREWGQQLGHELAWFADRLGTSRDREVLQQRLLAGLEALHHPDASLAERLVRRRLQAEAAAARRQVTGDMTTQRYLALLDALVLAANDPPLTAAAEGTCADVLPPLVTKAWRRLAREVAGLRRTSSDEEWHRARIRAKRARYAVGAVAPVFGKPARQFERQLEFVTGELGRHQDAAIAAQVAQQLAGGRGVSGRAGFVLGLLYAAQRAEAAEVRRTFLRRWPDVARPRRRRWL
ncbi:MAG: CHAD domain-containing protein [Actinomycetota bacterium]|nr:CHAD domain-containing protein [Actinomycetota bacterium]